MTTDETVRSIIHTLKPALVKWLKTREPDLIRCRLQESNPDATSERIKRDIAQSLENILHLSRRVIAYFSTPHQKDISERLTTEIEAVKYPGGFDARAKGVTVYYLPDVLRINSTLDDCLLAIPEQSRPEQSNGKIETSRLSGKKGSKRKRKTPVQFLKMARDHQIKMLIDDGLDSTKIAQKLECNPSTVVRSKAWQDQLSRERLDGIVTRKKDDSYEVDAVVYDAEPQD